MHWRRNIDIYVASEAERIFKESKERQDIVEKEVVKLKKEVDDVVFNEQAFKDNDEKILFYTGLTSWEVLNALFQ